MRHGLRFLLDAHIQRGANEGDSFQRGLAWTLRRRTAARSGAGEGEGEVAADSSASSLAFTVEDDTQYCYALAFCILALSSALSAGIGGGGDDEAELEREVRAEIDAMWRHAETRFYDARSGLYCDAFASSAAFASAECTPTAYRGQNCNMHMCEALLFAYYATHDGKYLERSINIAKQITVTLSIDERCGGAATLWEHFEETKETGGWAPDFEYNADAPKGSEEYMFRPWGLQPGHFWEWSKLLIQLDDASDDPAASWMLPRSRDLFWRAVDLGWSTTLGGAAYLVHPFDGAAAAAAAASPAGSGSGSGSGSSSDAPSSSTRNTVLDADRFYWVHCELLAAAGLLARAIEAGRVAPRDLASSGSEGAAADVWAMYDEAWAFCEAHFCDRNGGWFPMFEVRGEALERVTRPFGLDAESDDESRACVKLWPSKTEYHPVAMLVALLDAPTESTSELS